MAEFKRLADILSERDRPVEPPISALIAELPAPQQSTRERSLEERLYPALLAEKADRAVRTLLREIAAEVVGRELLLAPVEIDAIVRRLRERYRLDETVPATVSPFGDVAFVWGDGAIDASLGRRVAAAIDRATP